MITVASSGVATPRLSTGFLPAMMSPASRITSTICAYCDAVAGSTSRRRPAAKSCATTRIAIRPLEIRAQPEGVHQAVIARRPARGGPGNRRRIAIEAGQAFEQVAQHDRRLHGARLVRIQRIGVGPVAAQQDLLAVRRVSGLASATGAERQRSELRGNQLAARDIPHQAARLVFFKCTSRMDTAAGVTPATRAACPTVAGRICASFCRTSFDNPVMAE